MMLYCGSFRVEIYFYYIIITKEYKADIFSACVELYVTSQAKTNIVCTSDFGHLMAYIICQERHNDIKFMEMMELGLLSSMNMKLLRLAKQIL